MKENVYGYAGLQVGFLGLFKTACVSANSFCSARISPKLVKEKEAAALRCFSTYFGNVIDFKFFKFSFLFMSTVTTENRLAQKGHPKGLYVLFATEMWERFNYYGMRAILILFMTKALLYNDAFASNLYGSYTGLIYLSPLVGGYVADRFWGNKRSIITGGLLMAIGEFILFFCGSLYESGGPQSSLATLLFFSGLGFMITGNGFFKPNISSLVGQLYPKGDRRIDAAYTIFYMGINVGGMLGPIVCGLVGDTGNPADFKWAFLAGGIGMLLSVLVQKLYQDKYIVAPDGAPLGDVPEQVKTVAVSGKRSLWLNPAVNVVGLLLLAALFIGMLYVDANVIGYLLYLMLAAVIFIAFLIFTDKSLSAVEKRRVAVFFIVSFFVVFFWSAFEQAGASLNLFADRQTDRDLGFYVVPASLFQSLNSTFVVLFAPLFAWLWLKLGRHEPSAPTKMAIGLSLLALGYLWIANGVKDVAPDMKVSMIWLVGMYMLHTWGELCLSPIGLSLVNKLAPLKFASLLMAVWFLANAYANKLAGVLSSLAPTEGKPTSFLGYEMNNIYDFFMLFVFMAGLASLVLFGLTKKLQQMSKES
jgi:proton-dependent oligopeptide transporter, POT family